MAALTQKQKAYEFIREKLISGEFSAGTRLSDIALSRQIGVSRTPVREAIHQLASESLVELIPRNGAVVKSPDSKELEDLYDLRELLETYAARKAATEIGQDNLTRLRQLCDQMDSVISELVSRPDPTPDAEIKKRWMMTDYAFHQLILRAGGNQKVLRIATDLRMLTQSFIFRKDDPAIAPATTMQQANREHYELLAALEKGDRKAAVRILGKHLSRAKKVTLANYAHASQKPRSGEDPEWLHSLRDLIHT